MGSGRLTLTELLALIGRSWSRLLVYPGGLTLFGSILLAGAVATRRLDLKHTIAGWNLAPVAAPWLAVALLPLPGAAGLGRGIDALVALALLDTPLAILLAAGLRHTERVHREAGARRLAAVLNGYPPMLLSLLLLAFSSGSLELHVFAQIPPAVESAVLHWLGAASFVLAMPPVLQCGTFKPNGEDLPLALRVRAAGYIVLAALPWMTPFTGVWQVMPPLTIALLLWAFHRATANQPARPFAHAYVLLDVLLLLALLAGSALALSQFQPKHSSVHPPSSGITSSGASPSSR